ncbi:hypothetical protein V5799_005253 [Amblyomma americanum]|uniref:Peptidase M13 N-terminal domain-containing protein n=1 Tax=Amblyomma americanum TaxID=6943 RepID=A0AAQ4DZS6_AMBAM
MLRLQEAKRSPRAKQAALPGATPSLPAAWSDAELGNVQVGVRYIVTLAVVMAVFVTLATWFQSRRRALGGSKTCLSASCIQNAAEFYGTLNYSVDPCVDMDAFVCSAWRSRPVGGRRASQSLFAHVISKHERGMADRLLSGRTTFAASRIVTEFLRECTDLRAARSLEAFRDFFKLVSLPWPFDYNVSAEPLLHPLSAVLNLSLVWGLDTWFHAYADTAAIGDPGATGAPALFIEASLTGRLTQTSFHACCTRMFRYCGLLSVSAQPSLLLDVVRTQEANNGRRLYYQHMHEVYGAPMPDNGSMARRLHIEKHVLSILDAVRDTRIQARPAVSSLRRIAAPVREATLANWLEPLQAAFWWGSFDENTSVSVQDVRVLLAVDQLLLSHSSLDLLEQLSWWLVQRLTALGWPQGYIAVAGGKEVANHTVKEDCYSLAATRFGLLLASESAVKLFTRDSRRQAQAFLRDLLTVFRELAASASWLSEKARAVVNKTLQELQIVLWPPDVAISNASLWQLYSNFCLTCETADQAAVDGGAQAELAPDGRPTAMDHWMHANRAFSRLDPSLRERMQILWQGGAAEPFVFEHWKNRLRVSHAAVGTPLYHVTSAEGGGEEANYGGLGAAFLSHVLRSFDPPVSCPLCLTNSIIRQ